MDEGLTPVPKRGQEKLQVPDGIGLELASLVDSEFVQAKLVEACRDPSISIDSCQIRHLRFHPGKDSLIAYDVAIRQGDTGKKNRIRIFARCETEATYERELRRARAAATGMGKVLDEVLVLPDQRAMLIEFPDDSRLPHLPLIDSPSELAGVLESQLASPLSSAGTLLAGELETTLLKYKPERRLVCRCDTSWRVGDSAERVSLAVILRFERRGLARLVGTRATRLSQALASSDRLRSPRLLFADPQHELVGMECISGRSLADAVQGDDPVSAVKKAADCLATLHRCDAFDKDDPETTARLRSSDGSVELLGYSTESYAARAITIQQRLNELSDRTPAGLPGTVHGDFHQEQILVDEDCDWIVDVEWSGHGDTSLDLGSFLGQLSMLEIRKLIADASLLQEAFIERYQHHCGEVDRARLACEEVHMLLELAGKQFRRLKSSWPKRVGKILDRCEHILDAQGA